jgi:RNA polymerase sigma-70 factor, ECF subfamily
MGDNSDITHMAGTTLGTSRHDRTSKLMKPDVSDDARLIAETLAGQTSAFGLLVEKYQDRLFNTVVHLAGNVEDARDIVQEAFVQALVKLDSFRGASAFYTWLYRIAFNISAGWQRKRRPTVSIDRSDEQIGLDPADNGDGPVEQLQRQERCRQVRDALARLSDEHRTILVLREIEDCDYAAIAEILDVPVGTVRSRLHRARMELREELDETRSQNAERRICKTVNRKP